MIALSTVGDLVELSSQSVWPISLILPIASYNDSINRIKTPESSQSRDTQAAEPNELHSREDEDMLLDAKDRVETIFDRLIRVSVTIRKSGFRHRLLRADKSFECYKVRDLYSQLCLVLYATKDSSETRLNKIQTRLIEANLRRRHRFQYAQTHSKHLSGTPELMRGDRTLRRRPIYAETQFLALSWNLAVFFVFVLRTLLFDAMSQTSRATSANRFYTDSITLEETSATKATDLPRMDNMRFPSAGALTIMSVTTALVEWPSPPRVQDGAAVFKCPCCCQTLPVMFASGDHWLYVKLLALSSSTFLSRWKIFLCHCN
jgi:hypothetical protein